MRAVSRTCRTTASSRADTADAAERAEAAAVPASAGAPWSALSWARDRRWASRRDIAALRKLRPGSSSIPPTHRKRAPRSIRTPYDHRHSQASGVVTSFVIADHCRAPSSSPRAVTSAANPNFQAYLS